MNRKMLRVPADIFTREDDQAYIDEHFEEEARTERRLGNKYRTTIGEKEGGTDLTRIHVRNEADSMVNRFWQEIENDYGNDDNPK